VITVRRIQMTTTAPNSLRARGLVISVFSLLFSIVGYNGSDRITIAAGVPGATIDGGEGNGILTGDEGSDSLLGALGDDRLTGGKGDDSLTGASGADFLDGGGGRDTSDADASDRRRAVGAGVFPGVPHRRPTISLVQMLGLTD
jgi:RTX calcium-binding nonapeptide repeat (4 copies)